MSCYQSILSIFEYPNDEKGWAANAIRLACFYQADTMLYNSPLERKAKFFFCSKETRQFFTSNQHSNDSFMSVQFPYGLMRALSKRKPIWYRPFSIEWLVDWYRSLKIVVYETFTYIKNLVIGHFFVGLFILHSSVFCCSLSHSSCLFFM